MGTIFIGGGDRGFIAFFDVPSFLIVITIPLSMLLFAGQITDYFRAVQMAAGADDFTIKEFKSSSIALSLAIRMFYMSGIIGTVVGIIQILIYVEDPSNFGPAISISLLTFFYSIFFNTIHYAIKSRIDKEIVYREN